ncbi:MAG: aspartate-semialdehyde dehydrogenase [Rickettsiales bacterium]|nr:aspartate-semialdehyde dehydrogenase [Rickettsiales bacterium]
MSYKIAVVGATGNVGREILSILAERSFPVSEVVPLASSRSKGKKVSFGEEEELIVRALEDYDFTGTDIALFSPGSSISKEYAPKAAKQGCIVIVNTSYFRMHDDVPLVVPEVNPDAIAGYGKSNIIANPNCSTIQMVVALKPLHELVPIKRVIVSTYQSVSGAGKSAMDELYHQTKLSFSYEKGQPENFTKQIAFNVIPHIDVFMDDGFTKEEWKMMVETKKILDPSIEVNATCVRCPVFVGHAESLSVEFDGPITVEDARNALRTAPGIKVVDEHDDGGYITPVECVNEDDTFVSRIRKDPTVDFGINLWVVSDNLRKGAALNAVQIAENLTQNYI